MSDIQRYRTNHISGDYYPENGGELVLYADHVAALAAQATAHEAALAEERKQRDVVYRTGLVLGRNDERARIRAGVEALEPLLGVAKYKGGYDCCGCSTLDELHEDVLAVIDGEDK